MSITETDYSKIANKYDKNIVRKKKVDVEIYYLIQEKSKLKVIDIACGTGSYLKTQIEEYGTESIEWIGLDKSREMLSIAENKNPSCTFIQSAIDDLEINANKLKDADYIRNEFAFHHFENKEQAIKYISNILVNGGIFSMVNIVPDYMKNYWVYHYFPETIDIDEKRFIAINKIYDLLVKYGFDVDINVVTYINQMNYLKILNEAQNRDISQLNLIDDLQFENGIRNIKKDMENNKKMMIDISLLNLKAIKK